MITSTTRLDIRLIDIHDAAFFLALLNSPTWLKFIGDRKVYSIQDAESYIQKRILASYENHGFGFYKLVLKGTEQTIGACGFVQRTYLPQPDIGYAILPEFEGLGYTFEAAKAIMQYGEDILQLPIILGITADINLASQQVLKKIGLHRKGFLKDPETDTDILLFSNEER
ncbi:MAG: ribosomal-protein-alanine N-acetyltransferase [Marivirga sp.]|jgi:ribosomal-protein-alanine N-acetyltransferase